MPQIALRYLVQARSGDKGDTCDISIFAKTEEMFELLAEEVTSRRVKEHFAEIVKGEVLRYEMKTVYALKFILKEALGGGASASLRTDNLGKSFASNLLRLKIEVPLHLVKDKHCLRLPPRL